MNKHPMVLLAIALGLTCILTSRVQGKTGTSAQRSWRRIDFVGEVIKVNTGARSITLRSGGNTISLDVSNPVLQGYSSVAAIKKGDRVGAGYTADGIHITKLPRIEDKTVPEKGLSEEGVPSKKPSPFARRAKTDSKSFTDVDNNKDGKISPIELSVVIPNLTMEQFRQYDKNHDGYLNRAEFEQIQLP